MMTATTLRTLVVALLAGLGDLLVIFVVIAAVHLVGRSWRDATPGRQAWIRHTVKPNIRWWAHNLIAHPLLVLCPPAGRRIHDATIDLEGE